MTAINVLGHRWGMVRNSMPLDDAGVVGSKDGAPSEEPPSHPPVASPDYRTHSHRPKVVAVWSPKGGTGKTSLVYYLAHTLAIGGLSTMTVDCDNQQDLTKRTLYDHPVGATTLSGAVAGVFDAEFECRIRVPTPMRVRAHDGTEVPNLWHVAGGPAVEGLDPLAGSGCDRLGSIFHAIWSASVVCSAAVVLLDLSPAQNAINANLLTHCDYYMVASDDSVDTVRNVSEILPTFMKESYKKHQYGGASGMFSTGLRERSRGVRMDMETERARRARYPLPELHPKFLGVVLLHECHAPPDDSLRTTCVNLSAIAKSFSDLMDKFRHTIVQGESVKIPFVYDSDSNSTPAPVWSSGLLATIPRMPRTLQLLDRVLNKPMVCFTDSDWESVRPMLHEHEQGIATTVAHMKRTFHYLFTLVRDAPVEPFNFVFDSERFNRNPEGCSLMMDVMSSTFRWKGLLPRTRPTEEQVSKRQKLR